MALSLGGCDRGDVIAAHAVLAHFGDEGQLELLLDEPAEEAAHRMRLPSGLGDDVVDGDAGPPPQHLDHQILLALRRRCALLGAWPLKPSEPCCAVFAAVLRWRGMLAAACEGLVLSVSFDAEGEKPALGDEQAKGRPSSSRRHSGAPSVDPSFFSELSLAQGLDHDLVKSGALDRQAFRQGKK